jgi:hypothetical protein
MPSASPDSTTAISAAFDVGSAADIPAIHWTIDITTTDARSGGPSRIEI